MGMLGQHGDSTGSRAQHGSQEAELSMETAQEAELHGDSTGSMEKGHGDRPELSMETAWRQHGSRAQHGDSMGMLGQHGDSTAEGQSQGGISFSEENGKKKRREEFQVLFVVCVCCYATAIFLLSLLPSLLSYISTKAFSLHARHARVHLIARTTTTTGRVR